MKEFARNLTPFSPTGQIFNHMLRPITPPGPPVYHIAHPEDLGYPERKDTNQTLTPSEINESIFNEGLRLAGADILNLDNGKELLVFNTSAASTHTLFTVPYEQWDNSIREQALQLNFEMPSGVLIEGRGSNENEIIPPSHVPLDMVTWVMVREQGKQLYMPCDINDLAAPPNGDPNINQYKLSLTPEQLEAVNYFLARRNRLAINTILDLHNNVLVKHLTFLKPKKEDDLLIGGLSGYYRGDEAKDLKQFEYDHRGKGPMSNPTLHFRITDHFTMKEANILDQENPSTSFIEDMQSLHEDFPDYFSKNIDFLRIKPESRSDQTSAQVLAALMNNRDYSPYDIMKSVDPYGSLAH
ncbi:MAG TPA: hypothetical protein PLS49_06800, partial [Candidatus Woesebacteria bacterium]|nr:hypothetical protein [Candidatus Woesebacteria bacterium]